MGEDCEYVLEMTGGKKNLKGWVTLTTFYTVLHGPPFWL